MKRMTLILSLAVIWGTLLACQTPVDSPKPTNATLSSLKVSGATLSPAFSKDVTSYTASVAYSVASVTVTAASSESGASLTVNGKPAPQTVALAQGSNTVSVVVTGANGVATTYSIGITRALAPGNASLASLTLTGATLSPAFSKDVTSYSANVANSVTSVTVSASSSEAGASLTINGKSPSPQTVNLNVGQNPIPVVVTGVNGVATTYQVTVTRAPGPSGVGFSVLDSINGTAFSAYSLAVTDKDGVTTMQASSGAVTSLTLDPAKAPYTVLASVDSDHAVSTYQGLDPSKLDHVVLYAHTLGQITRPVGSSAVTITKVQKTNNADGSGAVDVAGVLDAQYLVVTATSYCGVEGTAWSGFGLKVDLDQMPTLFNGYKPDRYLKQSEKVVSGGVTTFVSTGIYDLSNWHPTIGNHELRIVAYDVANNRSETAVGFGVTGTSGAAGDISGCSFVGLTADLRSYGLTRDYFGKKGSSTSAVSNFDGRPTSYRGSLSFQFQSDVANHHDQLILGYYVERKTSGTPYVRVGTVNYPVPSTGSNGLHTYFETDPMLTAGVEYTYRVTAFTDDVHTKQSAEVSSLILPPFTASLVGPSNRSTQAFSNGRGPAYSFSISNQALWSAAVSDDFYFSLVLREKAGSPLFYASFRYHFATSSFEVLYNGAWYNPEDLYGQGTNADYVVYSNGVVAMAPYITLLSAVNRYNSTEFTPQKGVTYEWNIFGQYAGPGTLGNSDSMVPCWFEKDQTASGNETGVAKSYADTPAGGQDTLNGWFEMTVQ